jgi:hypothetical protein
MNRPRFPSVSSCFPASILAALLLSASFASGITPSGLVFEAEDIATPKDAWLKDGYKPDRWTLWTREQDIDKKRSRSAVLASPSVDSDRSTPGEGAPPLH